MCSPFGTVVIDNISNERKIHVTSADAESAFLRTAPASRKAYVFLTAVVGILESNRFCQQLYIVSLTSIQSGKTKLIMLYYSWDCGIQT